MTATAATAGRRPNAADARLLIISTTIATAVLLVVVVAWKGAHGFNDFYTEALPAYRALAHGQLERFAQLGPAYVGSLVLRAPFALLAIAIGGGPEAIYIATALPCLIAASTFGLWLGWNLPFRPERPVSHATLVVFCALNPLVVVCLAGGHPEEILGAALCGAALVLAQREKPALAGLALAFATVDKTWALVALPVVLVVLPSGRRRALLTMIPVTAAFLLPILYARQVGSAAGVAASLGSHTDSIFLAPQLLWWFGPHSVLAEHAHELIVLLPVPVAAVWWLVKGRGNRVDDREPILLLALVLLLRAALDPLDNLYYHIPFLFALMVYEADRLPRLTILTTVALMVVAPPDGLLSADGRAAGYALFAVPMILWLMARVYLPTSARARHLGRFPRPMGHANRVPG